MNSAVSLRVVIAEDEAIIRMDLREVHPDQCLVLGDDDAAGVGSGHGRQAIRAVRSTTCPVVWAVAGPGSPTAEAMVSNTIQCGFESHPGHP